MEYEVKNNLTKNHKIRQELSLRELFETLSILIGYRPGCARLAACHFGASVIIPISTPQRIIFSANLNRPLPVACCLSPLAPSPGSIYLPYPSWIGRWSATIQLLDLNADHTCSLNAAEQRELSGRMEKKQMKEFMTVSFPLCPTACLTCSSNMIFTDTL